MAVVLLSRQNRQIIKRGETAMPIWIWLRGKIWYFRHKPRGMPEINVSLSTTRRDVAVRKARAHLSALRVHESKRDMAQCILSKILKSHTGLEEELKNQFPQVFSVVEKPMLLQEWASEFIRLKKVGKKPISYQIELQYTASMRTFIEIVGNKPLRDVNVSDVETYVEELSGEEYDIEARTVVNKFKMVKTAFPYAVKRGLLPQNVFNRVETPEYDRRHVLPPPFELVEQLCNLPKIPHSVLTDESWAILPFCFRYTGCRLNEICSSKSDSLFIEDSIPCIKVQAGKAELRKKDLFPDGMKTVPLHPRLWPMLQKLSEKRNGLLFPDAGLKSIGDAQRPKLRYGKYFSSEYNIQSRRVWSQMRVHAWRSYLCSYLTKVAMVPEIVSQDIAGHATGTVHRGYAGMAPLRVRYEAVCKLP